MRLDAVIPTAPSTIGSVVITGLAYDSRAVTPGTLFFCVSGLQHDGHAFAPDAIAAGAVALVVQRPLGLGVPEVIVPSVRAAMAPAAARFHGDPSRRLRVVGITGTNGKTTTAFLVRALMEATGEPCGLLGTVKSVIGGVDREALRTTPEAVDLQADFAAMLQAGNRACAMEVSSHALDLDRADAVHFAAAVFTNLTQDHLDYHGTMEEYFLAKRRLFAPTSADAYPPALSVINLDDPYGRRLAAELPRAVTFGIDQPADYRAVDVVTGVDGARLRLITPAGERSLSLGLRGRFNVANALGALATTHALGGDLDTLAGALARGVQVPGRFQSVDEGQDFAVLVDYAHTPDSLANVLRAARELTSQRVVCVFGAGGDRDRTKRPLMGEFAAQLSEVPIVTSDNPRSEAPEAIITEIMEGARASDRPAAAEAIREVVDRREAIEQAVALARRGDVLVIAGKGHEQGQEFARGEKHPFDDVTVAREALRRRPAMRSGA